jgi:hypothetical protein
VRSLVGVLPAWRVVGGQGLRQLLISRTPPPPEDPDEEYWDSFEDVGEYFDRRVVTLSEYLRVEDEYVAFACRLLAAAGKGEPIRVRFAIIDGPLPWPAQALYQGAAVGLELVEAVLRYQMREGPGLVASFGTEDGQLSVGLVEGLLLDVRASVNLWPLVDHHLGSALTLVVDQAEDDDWLQRPADDHFWEEIHALAVDRPVWMLEELANGSYAVKWYRVTEKDVDDVRSSARPGAALRATTADPRVDHLPDLQAAFPAPLQASADTPELFAIRAPGGPDHCRTAFRISAPVHSERRCGRSAPARSTSCPRGN